MTLSSLVAWVRSPANFLLSLYDSLLIGGLGKIHDHFLFVLLGTATTHIVQCACTAVVSTMN